MAPLQRTLALTKVEDMAIGIGEKAIAGVDGLGAARQSGLDDALDDQVAFDRRRRADQIGFVSHLDMQGVAICLGVYRDRTDPELSACPDHTDGDFAAVGDEDLAEHTSLPLPYSGILPCFLGGLLSRLFWSISRARISLGRVSRGSM